MTQYSIKPKDQIFVRGYGFLFFAKHIGKTLVTNICKNLSIKYSQNLIDHAKQSTADSVKTASKQPIQKAVEVTGHLIGNTTANKITKVTRT